MKTRLLPILLVTLLLAFALPAPAAAADGIIYGDTIPAGTVIDHDTVLFGENVSIAGDVNGNVFVLGNQVVVTGNVDGNIVLIAQNAAISGDVSGTIYAMALTVDLPAGARLGRDLYAATVSLTSDRDAQVDRHLYALGLDAGLNGEVGGELHTALGPIQLYNGLMRLLGFDELTLELHFDVPAPASDTQGSVPSPTRHLRLQFMEPLPAFDWGTWALGLLRNWGTLFLFGLLAYWLASKPLQRAGEPLKANPLRTLAVGLLVLVVSLNLFVVALLLFVMIFAFGLGFNFLGLWQVSLALWLVAYAALTVAVLGLAYFIAYGTKLIVAYLFVSWLFDRLIQRKAAWLDLLALLAGTILYALLRSIPYAGWIVDILVTATGMGAAWLALQNRSKVVAPVEAPVVEPMVEPVVEPVKPAKTRKVKK